MKEEQGKLFEVLETFTMGMKMGEDAPKADREFLRLLSEGEEEHDIRKLYMFVDGYERGACLRPNEQIRTGLRKGYEISPDRVLGILEKKKNFIEKYFIISMSDEEMKKYYIKNEENEPLILFECLRQLFNRSGEEEDQEEIIYAAVRLAGSDPKLWEFWLQRVEYKDKWTSYLGDVLGRLDAEGLKIYAHSVHIDLPADRIKQITDALQAIPDDRIEFVLKNIAGILWERWNEYLCVQKETGKIQDGLVLTGYVNLILFSIFFLFADEDVWKAEFLRICREFEQDMFRWYPSSTWLSAYYFADLTQIYLFLLMGSQKFNIRSDQALKNEIGQVKMLMPNNRELWRRNGHAYEEFMELLGAEAF